MKSVRLLLSSALLVATAIPCVAFSHARRGPTSPKHTKPAPKHTGQRAIDDNRATEIQTALIKSGYLSGQASGHWDSQTEAAMQKFQSDNGWQTKLMPDSRAIIKLGLGPHQDAQPTASSPAFRAANPSDTPTFSQ
ncbi:putative peptidoglycan binding protein [Edaphobacter aggregans]|uniref:Putative peptidoglycan binding protein n=1 Tax=Edaphobacter aggregans TaxID=570835 RepID=A0A3R9P2D0_9BACT|nr:peptidoglycan-binding domain-containing protein [Edaphobacter aggregans]RSL19474.1 putative peptidoglycan binding protein [Edaphobacter aggregans]